MVESAAVRDIGEASVYVGMCSRVMCVGHVLIRYDRLRCAKAVSQNRLLRVVRHPLTRYIFGNGPCGWQRSSWDFFLLQLSVYDLARDEGTVLHPPGCDGKTARR